MVSSNVTSFWIFVQKIVKQIEYIKHLLLIEMNNNNNNNNIALWSGMTKAVLHKIYD